VSRIGCLSVFTIASSLYSPLTAEIFHDVDWQAEDIDRKLGTPFLMSGVLHDLDAACIILTGL
jgi:hypothetical protein